MLTLLFRRYPQLWGFANYLVWCAAFIVMRPHIIAEENADMIPLVFAAIFLAFGALPCQVILLHVEKQVEKQIKDKAFSEALKEREKATHRLWIITNTVVFYLFATLTSPLS